MRSNQLQRPARGFSLIELLIVISIIGILAAVAIPQLQRYLKTGRETAAVQSLRGIYNAEASYNATKGKYAALKDLAADELLDKNYASGRAVSQYTYSDSDVTADTFTAHADRASNGAGDKDFNITEKGMVFFIEQKGVKGTVPRGQGEPISGSSGEAAAPNAAASPASGK